MRQLCQEVGHHGTIEREGHHESITHMKSILLSLRLS
jgi:hypothetical protein